jgi:REP element-mobilizing transposase RayT
MNTIPPDHHRRSIRLQGYDYSQAGAYFITICTHQPAPLFGHIVGAGFTPAQKGEMQLNQLGQIACDQWQKIPTRFKNIELGEFVVMPNHVHGIIIINETQLVGAGFTPAFDDETPRFGVGAGFTPALDDKTPRVGVGAGFTPAFDDKIPSAGQPQGSPLRKTIGELVGTYKSIVANECLKIYKTKNETMGKLWQRNYYEHIIRDQKSYQEITHYILNNPAQWKQDTLYSGRK